jgi:hypothetical protein
MQISQTRRLRCHSAYFRGWAQAFGAHELANDERRGMRWLLGEEQLGLILTPSARRELLALTADADLGEEVDEGGRPDACDGAAAEIAPEQPLLGEHALQIGDVTLPIACNQQSVADCAAGLLGNGRDLHLYQTYHLIYPSGTRILTLSRRAPLGLIYREIEPLRIGLHYIGA